MKDDHGFLLYDEDDLKKEREQTFYATRDLCANMVQSLLKRLPAGEAVAFIVATKIREMELE